MRSRSGRLVCLPAAAMMSGLLVVASAVPAYAQGKPGEPAKPPAAAAKPADKPADTAAAGAKPADKPADKAAAGAKPADKPADKTAAGADKPAEAKKPLTEAQKKDAAKKAFKNGEEKFEKGEFEAALASY